MNLSGQTLGDYQLQSVIGRGPRATVYRARQMPVDRIVAVKVYDESIDPEQLQRIVESSEALTQANVLPVYGSGVYHGLAYVAMRHMPVGSVKSRWRGVVPVGDIARLLEQVASALDHAHDHNLLHLNLKPSNILIDHPGNAFVADFGIPVQSDSPYVAPEVARGSQPDRRADVYALGAVVYELLTGRAPVARRPHGDDKANQRMADLPSPRSIRTDIPETIEAVVMQALSIDPDSRFATPGDLADAFTQASAATPSERPQPAISSASPVRWLALGAIGLVMIVGLIVATNGSSVPAVAPSPLPTRDATERAIPSETPSPTLTHTPTLPPTSTPTALPQTPGASRTSTPPSATVLPASPLPTRVVQRTPVFSVTSLTLKPIRSFRNSGSLLDLYFDAIIQPATGGPYGQLFAYLPTIDSLVSQRIGAQVYGGTQGLQVTLVVECAGLPGSFTTNEILLQIRPDDRGPVLYSSSIPYTVTWCQ